jgi:hypothetical protein
MKILIQGTREFKKYEIFINALGRSIRSMDPEDSELQILTLGRMSLQIFQRTL